MDDQQPDFDLELAKYFVDAKGPRFTSPHELSVGPLIGEDEGQWTDRLARTGHALGIFRECSIGWHETCSQRWAGPEAECTCSCHAETPQEPI